MTAGQLPAMSEKLLQARIVEMAAWLGYEYLHIPKRQGADRGWRTAVDGGLGVGWPDLVLARPGRLVFIELKSENGSASKEQRAVLDQLQAAGAHVHLWKPQDWPAIMACLEGKERCQRNDP